MLTLLCYNIYWGKELGKIIGWIKKTKNKPDIVCFQEFPESKLKDFPKLVEELGYSFVFAPAMTKRKRRFGELTAFKKNGLKLLDHKIVELGDSKLDNTIFRYKSHRSSLVTNFAQGKNKFTVVNLQLAWFGLHKRRLNQLKKTFGKVNKTLPSIVVGDYNYSILLGRKRSLVKFMHEAGYQMAGERTITHRFLRRIPQQIDYAFYKDLKILEFKVGSVRYSDHFPILVKFDL
jgi:endonuclease/exonuclease/phosphatase family metal-dependent hydrolase